MKNRRLSDNQLKAIDQVLKTVGEWKANGAVTPPFFLAPKTKGMS